MSRSAESRTVSWRLRKPPIYFRTARDVRLVAPLVSSINFRAGGVTNNNMFLKLSSDGLGRFRAFLASGSTHFIFDVNGYFSENVAD